MTAFITSNVSEADQVTKADLEMLASKVNVTLNTKAEVKKETLALKCLNWEKL